MLVAGTSTTAPKKTICEKKKHAKEGCLWKGDRNGRWLHRGGSDRDGLAKPVRNGGRLSRKNRVELAAEKDIVSCPRSSPRREAGVSN